MPPKNKKQIQLQAERLEQQRKRKQEQKLRQEEQIKFGKQTLDTGLTLPYTEFMIYSIFTQQRSFFLKRIEKVLEENAQKFNEFEKNLLLTELIYNIRFGFRIWNINEENFYKKGNDLLKLRIFLAIMYEVWIKDNKLMGGQDKSKEKDMKLFKELLHRHSISKQNHMKIFSNQDLVQIVKYAQQSYFAFHELFLTYFKSERTFPILIRQVTVRQVINVDIPMISPQLFQAEFIPIQQQLSQSKLNKFQT